MLGGIQWVDQMIPRMELDAAHERNSHFMWPVSQTCHFFSFFFLNLADLNLNM